MRIFFIITVSEYGGAQSVVSNLAEELSKDIANEIYIVYGGNGEAWQHLNPRINLLPITKHRKELSYKDFGLVFKLLYIRYKYKPDIVHLHSSKMTALGRLVFNPKTVICTLHGFDSVRKAYPKFMFIEKMLKNRTKKIIAVSNYDVIALKEENIFKNVELVYNGVIDRTRDTDFIEKSNSELINKIQIIKNKYAKIVICIARISKQKKFDLFLDIAKALPNFAFVWIGNKEVITDVPSNVFCLGEASSAYLYLRYADLFILPTNYEGLPISLLEALSFNIPVVASAVGGITEVLDGTNGFAVDNSLNAFVDKINYILNNENIHSSMKVAARKSYEDKYTIALMAKEYDRIFKNILLKRN